jgi:hypothetical protein
MTNSSTVEFYSKPDAERHSQLALAGDFTQNPRFGILRSVLTTDGLALGGGGIAGQEVRSACRLANVESAI